MLAALCCALLQIALPPPRGYVNDFAGVIDPPAAAHLDATIAEVQEKTRGEIVVVTLSDIGDRAASDVALDIGRTWKVGPGAPAGDPVKNLGVVVLLVPRKNHRPGTGKIFIATGRGAEGFLTDARVGRIEDAMLPDMAREAYGTALARGVDLIAQAFAAEFKVALSGGAGAPSSEPDRPNASIPLGWLLAGFILLMIVTRGRLLSLLFWFAGFGSGRRSGGGWGGGSFGGGGFGGGFGGFGGGGGFSGGGAGRSF